jgi:hypothetical protein
MKYALKCIHDIKLGKPKGTTRPVAWIIRLGYTDFQKTIFLKVHGLRTRKFSFKVEPNNFVGTCEH